MNTPLPAESCHYYYSDGRPCYEVPRSKGDGMRPTTLADARKLKLVPSFTTVLRTKAKPGLESWKQRQILMAALTLPRNPDESEDDYADRVISDSEAQGKAAMDRGTAIHEAIELYVQGKPFSNQYSNHVLAVEKAMHQIGLTLTAAKAEKSFATPYYGGKIDWQAGDNIADFKTKDRIDHGKKLYYDEHVMQLAAYSYGGGSGIQSACRLLSIFVGVEDEQVMIYEWPFAEVVRGWEMFKCYLRAWYLEKQFGEPPGF